MDEGTKNSASAASFQGTKCSYCGAAISAHQMLNPGHCDQDSCKLAHISKGIARQKKRRADEYGDRQAIARAGVSTQKAAAMFSCNKDDLVVAVVPSQESPLVPLPLDRKEAFIEHLKFIMSAAASAADDTGVLAGYQHSSNSEPSIVEAGCTACQGHCCTKGGGTKFAFLTHQSIFYLLDKKSDWDIDSLTAAYVDAIPETSVEDSCVYHGPDGCCLKRNMRAAICNSFYCHDLYALHELTGGRSDLRLLIVGINENEVGKSIAGGGDKGFELVPENSVPEPR